MWSVRVGSSELLHYGVKGMKWGVRKDPKTRKDAPGEARSKKLMLERIETIKREFPNAKRIDAAVNPDYGSTSSAKYVYSVLQPGGGYALYSEEEADAALQDAISLKDNKKLLGKYDFAGRITMDYIDRKTREAKKEKAKQNLKKMIAKGKRAVKKAIRKTVKAVQTFIDVGKEFVSALFKK